MKKENIRILLWVALFSIGFFLYTTWEKEDASKKQSAYGINSSKAIASSSADGMPESDDKNSQKNSANTNKSVNSANDVPAIEINNEKTVKEAVLKEQNRADVPDSRIVKVKTDVLDLELDLKGGDVVKLILPKYPQDIKNKDAGFVLLNDSTVGGRYYIAQSGLLSADGPDSKTLGRATYKVEKNTYLLGESQENIVVDLHYVTPSMVNITKRYVFTKGSYLITVEYIINNAGRSPYSASLYGRLKRAAIEGEGGGSFMGMRTYTGAAINTPDKSYYKISFDDMRKKVYKESVVGGWAAMIEHYFTSAWIPSKDKPHVYSSEDLGGNMFGIRFVSDPITVNPHEEQTVGANLFVGPEIADILKEAAKGLDLTVDYGILWPICQPIFWVLKTIHGFIGNWGVAIILTTLLIKLLFFKLSATSYRSMGNMKKLQPKIEALKQRFGDDKQGFGKAIMELYKKEKVNPLGGCLPILVQIPVFIALYYVLLESVELRHAPFFFWIQDLSAKDPYYVLPVLMGISMLVQQKLSPAPPDPIQAKVMMAMPIVFTFLFIQFPSGLVLYWVVNNTLSILQQWYITRRINASSK